MGKNRSWLKDRSNSPERTPAGNSPYYRPLNLEILDDTSLAEGKRIRYRSFRRKKRLDPGDFVALKDGFHTVDICHFKCAGKLKAILSETLEEPQETWETSSLPIQRGGIPIDNDLHCIICDGENPDWIYEDEGKDIQRD